MILTRLETVFFDEYGSLLYQLKTFLLTSNAIPSAMSKYFAAFFFVPDLHIFVYFIVSYTIFFQNINMHIVSFLKTTIAKNKEWRTAVDFLLKSDTVCHLYNSICPFQPKCGSNLRKGFIRISVKFPAKAFSLLST